MGQFSGKKECCKVIRTRLLLMRVLILLLILILLFVFVFVFVDVFVDVFARPTNARLDAGRLLARAPCKYLVMYLTSLYCT